VEPQIDVFFSVANSCWKRKESTTSITLPVNFLTLNDHCTISGIRQTAHP